MRPTRAREPAVDLTAETFAAVVADLSRFDRERGSAPGYVMRVPTLFERGDWPTTTVWRALPVFRNF